MSDHHDQNQQVPLYLFTGFLGSGKTTLINQILKLYPGKNIGILLNDFGNLAIDKFLIPVNSTMSIRELNGGQIFCSCLSGSFINAIASFADVSVDMLLVESSGLAKPSPINEIIRLAYEKSNHFFEYRGMICIIDAVRYQILEKSVLILKEQIQFSDKILINKTDLIDSKRLKELERSLKDLHPGIEIQSTNYCSIQREFLESMKSPAKETFISRNTRQGKNSTTPDWGKTGRPITITIRSLRPVDLSCLLLFLNKLSPHCLRIKGFVTNQENILYYVDYSGSSIRLESCSSPANQQKSGIVFIFPDNSKIPDVINQLWMDTVGTEADVIL